MKLHFLIAMGSLLMSLSAFGQVLNKSMMRVNNCGSTFNGQNTTRQMYQSANVNEPSACVSEAQSATCNNGTIGSYTGSYSNAACTASRTRYSTTATTCPTPCAAETQTQNCTNGSCGSFSGTYTNGSCTQNPTSSTINIWQSTYHSDPYDCNYYYDCTGYAPVYDNETGAFWGWSCASYDVIPHDTCYNNYYTCDYIGTATKNCSVTTNTTPGTWGAYAPNAANYFSDGACTVRY